MNLNPAQIEVVRHADGRMLALAGPGSGKTRTLTERTCRLSRNGVLPASILCLTFTNKARDEMRSRLLAAMGDAGRQVFVSNFHGLCGTILRKLGQPLGYDDRMTICDADDQVDLILQTARRRGLEPTRPAARSMAWICNEWRESLADGEAGLPNVADGRLSKAEMNVVRAYVALLRERNQCDFSGLLSETVALLRSAPEALERLRRRFRFIQVDEYQDTNKAQNEIVELLAGNDDNILAVGDADQSIYEWRGASPEAIPKFIEAGERKTGACAIIKLGLNYRSSPQIIQTADRLIRHCRGRIAVEFGATRPAGELPRLGRFDKPEQEADAIAGGIETIIRDGIAPNGEIAVFYRTNDMSRLIEQALTKRHIPYQVVGSGSYYDRMEVKDLLSMLRFVCNPRDGIAFHRIANKPARGMGDTLIGKLEAFAEQAGISLLEVMRPERASGIRDEGGRGLGDAALRACGETLHIFGAATAGRSVGQIAGELYSRSGYDRWLSERYEKEELQDRQRNVRELLASIGQFSAENPRSSIGEYLQSISLYTQADEPSQENGAVRLMSLHACKGLEFDVVYMIGVEQGILPHEKAVGDRGERGLDEERRLCYVGFTRARKVLRVSWCAHRPSSYAGGKSAALRPSRPSRFLMEAGLMGSIDYESAVEAAGGVVTKKRPAITRPTTSGSAKGATSKVKPKLTPVKAGRSKK